MLWILSFHIIFVVAWFAGLFYLPRLFVYHASATDQISLDRFKVMEHKLFYMIMTPVAILATVFGLWLISLNPDYYLHASWLHFKLTLVAILWAYHIYCAALLKAFKQDRNRHCAKFYRFFNEAPALLLFAIVILAVVKP